MKSSISILIFFSWFIVGFVSFSNNEPATMFGIATMLLIYFLWDVNK